VSQHRIGTATIHHRGEWKAGQGPASSEHVMLPSCWCKPFIVKVTCSCETPADHPEWDRPVMLPNGRVVHIR
jgi:hypothetical protein